MAAQTNNLVIPIVYVASQEEAKIAREEFKKCNQKAIIFISGKEDIKENLKNFLKAREI